MIADAKAERRLKATKRILDLRDDRIMIGLAAIVRVQKDRIRRLEKMLAGGKSSPAKEDNDVT